MLTTYAIDVIITEAEIGNVSLKQPARQSALEYVQPFWSNALRCGPIYDEYRLKATFIEGLIQ